MLNESVFLQSHDRHRGKRLGRRCDFKQRGGFDGRGRFAIGRSKGDCRDDFAVSCGQDNTREAEAVVKIAYKLGNRFALFSNHDRHVHYRGRILCRGVREDR